MAAEKSKILVIGGTGHLGKFIVEASAKEGHPTFALVRQETLSNPAKATIVDNFKNLGVTLVHVRASNYLTYIYTYMLVKITVRRGVHDSKY